MLKSSQSSRNIRNNSENGVRPSTTKNSNSIPMSDLMAIQMRIKGQGDNKSINNRIELYNYDINTNKSKQKSTERMKNWPTTINTYKKNKDEYRFERFRKDEELRRQQDIDEEQYQKEVKKVVLQKANAQLFENNDRIRAFQTKLLQSDAYQERDAQMAIESLKRDLQKFIRQQYQQAMEDMRREEEKEIKKKADFKTLKEGQMKQVKIQHDEVKEKLIRKMQENKIEGELLRINNTKALEREILIQEQQRQKKIINLKEVNKNNAVLQEFKYRDTLKDMDEEEKNIQYCERKNKIGEIRKLREVQKFNQKQIQKQRLLDTQNIILEKKLIDQKEREIKHMQEAAYKDIQAEQKKIEKKKQLEQQIVISRGVRKEVVSGENEFQKEQQKEFQQYWKKRNLDLQLQDDTNNNKINERIKDLSLFQKEQVEEKQVLQKHNIIKQLKRHKEIVQEYDEAVNQQRQLEEEEKVFERWAMEKIKQQSADGKAILPLIKELKSFKYQ